MMADCNKTIGYRIATVRGSATESQADLAAALSVKREMVTYWENGTRPIKAETIIEIAKRYNVSSDYLLGLSDTPAVSEDMKTAVKVTGLTEKAIENARQFCYPVIGTECERWSILSELMETDGFRELIVDIEDLYEAAQLLDDQYSCIVNGMEMKESCSDGNPFFQAVISAAEKPYTPKDMLIHLYDHVRLEKYELRDAFAAILEKLIPTAEILSSVKKVLREYGGLSAFSGHQHDGGKEDGEH